MASDETIATLRAKHPRSRLRGQIQFAREAFRNDGAEGETAWALAAAAEQLPALLDRLERAEALVEKWRGEGVDLEHVAPAGSQVVKQCATELESALKGPNAQ
jgi:hypothetical protein